MPVYSANVLSTEIADPNTFCFYSYLCVVNNEYYKMKPVMLLNIFHQKNKTKEFKKANIAFQLRFFAIFGCRPRAAAQP